MNQDEILSEMTRLIVEHLESMPESERKERLAAFRDSVEPQVHIKENRFGGSLIEYGVITALFEDIPESEIGVTSGAQVAFRAARTFIKEMVENQCKLAGCSQEHWGFVHADKCWFAKRAQFYRDRNAHLGI
jgi:hypothetical protein